MTSPHGLRSRCIAVISRAAWLTAAAWLLLLPCTAQTQYFPGLVKRQLYPLPLPIKGLGNLMTNALFPQAPQETDYLRILESPTYVGGFRGQGGRSDYGLRITGFLTPTNTDAYVFYLSATNQAELWVSGDTNLSELQLVALEPVGAGVRDWTSPANRPVTSNLFPAQRQPNISLPVSLNAGQRYFVQILMVDNSGKGHAEVAWAPSNGSDPTNGSPGIGAAFLGTYGPTNLAIDLQPLDQTVYAGQTASFLVSAEGYPPSHISVGGQSAANLNITWFVGSSPRGNGASFKYGPVAYADNGAKVKAVVSDFSGPFLGSVTSRVATIFVPLPTNGPVVQTVSGFSDLQTLEVRFSQAMAAAPAAIAANYALAPAGNPAQTVTIHAASLKNTNTVVLKTDKLYPAEAYVLTFPGVNLANLQGVPLQTTSFEFVAPVFHYGLARYERWDGFSGTVSDLITNYALAGIPPSSTAYVSSFETPPGATNIPFGGHLVTDFVPPATGDYVFFVAATNQALLYLGLSEDPLDDALIAEEPVGGGLRQWASKVNRPNGENRSDRFAGSQWPTGPIITLEQGLPYHLDLYFVSADGLGYAGATYSLGANPDPSDGSIATVGYSLYTAVDPGISQPAIVQRPAGQHFNPGDTINLSVTAIGAAPLSYYWYQNKLLIPGATNATLTIRNAGVTAIGDYYCLVSNHWGTATSYPDDDARLLMNGAYVVEAEDFNYNGGSTLPAASFMPLSGGLFQGLDGLPQYDFTLLAQSSTNAADGGNAYRNGWVDAEGNVYDYPHVAWDARANVDIYPNGADVDRGDFSVSPNYRVTSLNGFDDFVYTRDFPPGLYNVLAALSQGGFGIGTYSNMLEVLTAPPTQRNAPAQTVGWMLANGTGAVGSNDLPLFTDTTGRPAEVPLGAATSFRMRGAVGGTGPAPHDLDYLLFYLVGGAGPGPTINIAPDQNGVITIQYTGSLQSAPSPTGPWTAVVNAPSPYQPDTTLATSLFYRSSQ